MEDQVLYHFQRSRDEFVYLRLREYKEKKYLDLRIFYQPKDGDEHRPTTKGITLALELLPELKKGILACEKKLQAVLSRV